MLHTRTTTSKESRLKKALTLLDEIDFGMIKRKLQDTEEGLGRTPEQCAVAETDYKRFLALKFAYPEEEIVPNQVVDKFWHYHILDTQAYARDCQKVLGYFLHHYPYFGMQGEQDLRNLHLAFADTSALYLEHFGSDYDGAKQGGRGKCRTAYKPMKCK